MKRLKSRWLALLFACLGALAFAEEGSRPTNDPSPGQSRHDESSQAERVLNVIATAYNSTHAQTDAHPNIGGWGIASSQE